MVVDCHHVACVVCVVTEKNRIFFLYILGFFFNWEKAN